MAGHAAVTHNVNSKITAIKTSYRSQLAPILYETALDRLCSDLIQSRYRSHPRSAGTMTIFSEPNSGAGIAPALDETTKAEVIAALKEKTAKYERESKEHGGLGVLALAAEMTKGMIVQSGPSGINPLSGIPDQIEPLMDCCKDMLKGVAKLNLKKQTKEDIYRTMHDLRDLLMRTSKNMQEVRIKAEETFRILEDIDLLLAKNSPQENATPHIQSRVAKLIIALNEGSSQATIEGLNTAWKTMQDRLKNCAKTVEAEEKGARNMWRAAIASVASIAGSLGVVAAIALTDRAPAAAVVALSVASEVGVGACASSGVGIRAAADKKFMDTVMSEAAKMSKAVVGGLEMLFENAGKIDTLPHSIEKKDIELASKCLGDAESAQLRGCMERFKKLTADTKSVLSKHTDDIMKCKAQLDDLIETFDNTILPGAVKL